MAQSMCPSSVAPLPKRTCLSAMDVLPTSCVQRVLEYVYRAAVDHIEFKLYSPDEFDEFPRVLANSKVPTELRGCALEDGKVLLCEGQLPLTGGRWGLLRSLGIINPRHEEYFVFRESHGKLQAAELLAFQPMRGWWTIGKILDRHQPVAALSKTCHQVLSRGPPCNFKYILNRRSQVAQFNQPNKPAGHYLIVCKCGEAPYAEPPSESENGEE